jgi:drug/metabolite transporter (DMT)-like permease
MLRDRMLLYYPSLAIVVAGTVIYHLSIKQVPKSTNPFFSLLIAYLAAAALCSVLLWTSSGEKQISRANLGVAVGVLGIETGFLLAYRAGWPVGSASLTANVLSALILLPIGFFLFAEKLSLQRGIGVALCILGLALVIKRG